jgi:hypothetical protein
VIAKGFFLAKDFYRIGAKILRDHGIVRIRRPGSARGSGTLRRALPG